jgi:hypothetical protein
MAFSRARRHRNAGHRRSISGGSYNPCPQATLARPLVTAPCRPPSPQVTLCVPPPLMAPGRGTVAGAGRPSGCVACRAPEPAPSKLAHACRSAACAGPPPSEFASVQGEAQRASSVRVASRAIQNQTLEPRLRSMAGKSARTMHKPQLRSRYCVATPGIRTRSSAWRRSPPASGQPERAQELYLQVLESDPGDVSAQAALDQPARAKRHRFSPKAV